MLELMFLETQHSRVLNLLLSSFDDIINKAIKHQTRSRYCFYYYLRKKPDFSKKSGFCLI
jgi:hypothetical protein